MNPPRVPLLALETSDDYCSVALWDGNTIYQEKDTEVRRHAERLMALVTLMKGYCKEGDYQDIVLSVGPGSFTGIRAGLAAAIGFSLARKALGRTCRLYPVTSLHGLVMAGYQQNPHASSLALGVLSAGRGRLYAQRFQRTTQGLIEALEEPQIFADIAHLQSTWNAQHDQHPMMLCCLPNTLTWDAPFIALSYQAREARSLCLLAQNQPLLEKTPQPVYLSTHVFKTYSPSHTHPL